MSDERTNSPEPIGEVVDEVAARLRAVFDKAQADPGYMARVAAERDRLAEEDEKRKAWEGRLRLEQRGIPAKDIGRLLIGANPTAGGYTTGTKAMAAARDFLDDGEQRILVLAGTRGCGKTFAASWIAAQECPDPYFDRATTWPGDLHPRFLDAPQLARLPRYDGDVMGPLERCSMLVLDDLGMEYADAKGAFYSLLDGLINARYAARVRTIITTNVSAKPDPGKPGADFKARYGERIADRIREVGRFVEISGASLRGAAAGVERGGE